MVTGNANKLREYQEILGQKIEQLDIDLPELQGTVQEIVKEKARLAAEKAGKPCFVDDASLCFDTLGGLPGPYIKHFLKAVGNAGLSKMLEGFDDKGGLARAAIGFCRPGEEPHAIIGEVKGTIVTPRGKTNFGWDPIFQPDGYDKTFAEMGAAEKNEISHRKLAAEKFKEFLREYINS